MELIEVRSNKWPADYLRMELALVDICNFQCWYCWPEAHAAKYKWPDYDLLVKNLSYLIEYYIENTNKRKFELALLGGEVTHWKRFIDFVKHFKEKYDCIITITTNASKSLDWWKEASKYLSYVCVSHHQRFSKKEHNRELLDYLYEQKIVSLVTVLMDPNCWEDCLESIEYYKKSKHSWAIRYHEIIHQLVNYTPEQKDVIRKVRARRANPFWFYFNNKLPVVDVRVVDSNNKIHKFTDKDIILNRLNNFEGWECSLGVEFLSIRNDGRLTGTCNNYLYDLDEFFNIYDLDFITKFKPKIIPTTCTKTGCWCATEANLFKKKK